MSVQPSPLRLWDLPGPTRSLAFAIGLAALGSVVSSPPAAAQASPPEVGVWYDDTGDGAVEIHPCGTKMLCGRIVWLRNPINAEGEPLHDKYNPDPTMRSRPICGLTILANLIPMTDGSWDRGTVYDPKKGSSHEAAIKLLQRDRLQLTGFGLGRLLSKSFIWTRAPADLSVCTPLKSAPNGTVQGSAAPKAPVGNGTLNATSGKPASSAAATPVPATAPAAASTGPSAAPKTASQATAAPATAAPPPATVPTQAAKANENPAPKTGTTPTKAPAANAAATVPAKPKTQSAGLPVTPAQPTVPPQAAKSALPGGTDTAKSAGEKSATAVTTRPPEGLGASVRSTGPVNVAPVATEEPAPRPRPKRTVETEPVGGLVTLPRP